MSRFRRSLAAAALGTLLVAAAGAGLVVHFLPAFLKTQIERTAAAQLGLRLEVTEVRIHPLKSVTIGGLRTLEAAPKTVLAGLDVQEATARFHWPALLQGSEAFLAASAIELRNARVELDLQAGSGEERDPPAQETARIDLPPRLPALVADGIDLLVIDGDRRLELRNAGFHSRPPTGGEEVQEFLLQAAGLFVQTAADNPLENLGNLELPLSYRPDRLQLASASLGARPFLEKATITWPSQATAVTTVDAALLLFGGRQQVHAAIDADRLEAELNLADTSLGPLARLLPANTTTGGTLSGHGSLLLPFTAPSKASVSLRLETVAPRYNDIGLERLLLRGGFEQQTLKVDELLAENGRDRLSLLNAALPLSALEDPATASVLDALAAEFFFSFHDLPALFALAELPGEPAPGLPDHLMEVRGSLKGGLLTAESLHARLGKNRLNGSGLRIPARLLAGAAPQDPLLADFSGRLQADLQDPAALAALFGLFGIADPPLVVDTLAFEAEIAGTSCRLQHLAASLPGSEIRAERLALSLAPAAFADPAAFLYHLESDLVTGSSTDLPLLLERVYVTEPGQTADLPAHRLTLHGRFKDGTISLPEAELTAKGSTLSLAGGEVRFPAPGIAMDQTAIDLDLLLEADDIGLLASLFGNSAAGGSLRGRVAVSGPILEPSGSYDLLGTDLRWTSGMAPFEHALFTGTADQGILSLNTFELRQRDNRVHGRGTYHLGKQTLESVDLGLSLPHPEHLAPLLPAAAGLLGRVEAHLSATGPLLSPTARLVASLTEGSYGGRPLDKISLVLSSDGRRLTVEELLLDSRGLRLDSSGSVDRGPDDRRFDIRIAAFGIARNGLALAELQRPVLAVYERDRGLRVDELLLAGPVGSLHGSGRLDADGRSALNFSLRDLTTDHAGLPTAWTEYFSFTDLDLDLKLAGRLQNPQAAFSGSVLGLRAPESNATYAGTFRGSYQRGEGFLLEKSELAAAQGGDAVTLRGRLPLDPLAADPFLPGPLSVSATLSLADLESFARLLPEKFRAAGNLQSSLELSGTWDQPHGLLQIEGKELRPPQGHTVLPAGPFGLKARLAADGLARTIELADLRLAGPELDASIKGSWHLAEGFRAALQRSEAGGRLDLKGTIESRDLGWLARHVPAVRRLGGTLRVDATVSGPPRTPAMEGTVRLRNGEVRPASSFPPVRALALDAKLFPDKLEITDSSGELGGSPFRLTGTVEHYLSAAPVLALKLDGTNLLLYREDGVKVRADTGLEIKGPLDSLLVAGDLSLTDGAFSKDFDFLSPLRGTRPQPEEDLGLQLFSIPEPPLSQAKFRIKIGGAPFRIRNNVIKGTVRPALNLGGSGELPVLTGKIYLDPMQVSMPAGRIQVSGGLVRFQESDPDRPLLDLAASSRMQGYDIAIQVQGPLAEPAVTLSSSPPLPNDELLLLLLTGTPPKSTTTAAAARKGGMNVALYLGRGMLRKLFNTNGDLDETILDRFSLEIGRGVTRLGEETVEAQFRLAEDVFREDDVLFIVAERDVYDAFNSGVKIVFRFK